MWKRAVIYLLLLSFINTAFLPGENVDDTPFNGVEEVEEECNSLFELIAEGMMHIQDDSPEDEDDDIPDWLKKTTCFFYRPVFVITLQIIPSLNDYENFVIINPYFSFLKIFAPPPKLS